MKREREREGETLTANMPANLQMSAHDGGFALAEIRRGAHRKQTEGRNTQRGESKGTHRGTAREETEK